MTAATPAEKLTMYAAGLVQGITLVTFPAASAIFTSPASYDLSAAQYGTMFVPQVVAAIAASLAGPGLAARFGWKLVYLAGLTANLASMALLIASRFVETDQSLAYPILLGILAFGPAGLGCSALLPLTISFGQESLTAISASVAGGVIAFCQLGYGLAAFGVGPLRSAGFTRPEIYAASAAVAALLAGLSFAIAGGRPSPAALHPRPASHLR